MALLFPFPSMILLEVTHMYKMLHTLFNANDEEENKGMAEEATKDMFSHPATSC
jgi:hypothetical protein